MLVDLFLIFLASCLSALIGEGLSWLLIYRTESYQKLQSTIDKTTKKLEKKDAPTAAVRQKGKGKKMDRYEETLKTSNREMSFVRMKSMFAITITFVVLVGILNSLWDGKIVAKLPFEPVSIFRSLSHRNLPGTDFTDCSMIFFYILSSMSVRATLQKLLGVTPRSTPAMSWFTPPETSKRS